ncbi:MAG: magnesium transporter CorA family protein [Slackia sp.]|nr:magnesium transporter CorA family protein [Slackia sp.]
MIEYFHVEGQSGILTKIDREKPGCWIALFEPTQEELTSIAERFSIDEDDIRAPLDLEEVSRIERNADYTMFIVDTPMHVKNAEQKRYTTIPIGIFEVPGHVISVCSVYRVPLIAILKSWRNVHDTADVKAFASDILIASSQAYFASLHAINKRRIGLSNATDKPERKDLQELYALDASLVYIKTSLTTNDTVFERYRRYAASAYTPEMLELLDDAIIENKQALETTKIYSEILDSTINHFGLMMDYDLNHTMQLVATITLVLCVPTVIGGVFGMNLEGIPLADSPYGFAIVTGATALALVVMLVILKRLKWF